MKKRIDGKRSQKFPNGQMWWFMPVIFATWKVEADGLITSLRPVGAKLAVTYSKTK
jgi:hypothetical protein